MQEKQPHIVDVIFVLTLFGLFALSALALIVIGSGIYQNTVNNMQSNYETRTSTSYISEKIRQGSSVSYETINDRDVLYIGTTLSDKEYVTYLYTYGGYLRELFVSADTKLTNKLLPAGQKITEVSNISIEKKSDGIIQINISQDSDTTTSMLINTYSGE